jgi:PAS domain S-box-containing protein
VVLAGVAVATGTVAGRLEPRLRQSAGPREWVVIGLALVVAGSLTLNLRHHGEIDAFDVFEVALTPALYFLPGLGVVLLVAAAKIGSQAILRMPIIKLAFNGAQWAACAGCGALAFVLMARAGHPDLGLVVAMAAVTGVNLLALLGLFALLEGPSGARQLLQPRSMQWSVTISAVTIAAGVGITLAAEDHPAVLLFLVALPVLLHWVGRGYTLARVDLDRLRGLHAGTRALSAMPDIRLDPTPFLVEVARSCHAEGAELALSHDTDDGFEVYRYHVSTRSAEAGAHPARSELARSEMQQSALSQGVTIAGPVASPSSAGPAHPADLADSARPPGSAVEAALTRAILAEHLPLHAVAQPRSLVGRWPTSLRVSRRLASWSPTSPDAAPKLQLNVGAEITTAVRAAGWRDALAVPLRIDGEEAGVLAVYDRSGFADLDEADLATLEAFAREVAAALQRAALVDEIVGTRRHAARIIESSSDGIVAIAEDGSVVTWNQGFVTLTGHSKEEVLGPGGLGLLDARDADGEPVLLAQWAQTGPTSTPMPSELTIRGSGGGRRWLSCSYTRTNPGDGDGDLLVVVARDVTDLRRQRDLITGQGWVLELIASGEPLGTSLDAITDLVGQQLDCPVAILLMGGDPDQTPQLVAQWDGAWSRALPFATEVVERLTALPPKLWAQGPSAPVLLGSADLRRAAGSTDGHARRASAGPGVA